jgi:hypothetical protein
VVITLGLARLQEHRAGGATAAVLPHQRGDGRRCCRDCGRQRGRVLCCGGLATSQLQASGSRSRAAARWHCCRGTPLAGCVLSLLLCSVTECFHNCTVSRLGLFGAILLEDLSLHSSLNPCRSITSGQCVHMCSMIALKQWAWRCMLTTNAVSCVLHPWE